MHGKNRVRKQELNEDGTLQVAEVFYTIQGEGPHSGRPAVFLRLTGCNLRCWFCDTHWDDDKDAVWPVDELARQINHEAPYHCDLLVVTGGEPLRQNLAPLFAALWSKHAWQIQIETAGTLWQPVLEDGRIDVVVSPKTTILDPRVAERANAFKYVVRAGEAWPEDGLPAVPTQVSTTARTAPLARPLYGQPIYLSPCDEGDPVKNALNRAEVARLAMQYGYRAGIQLHKVLELP